MVTKVTLWGEIVLSSILKFLSIAFVRYDLAHKRADISGVMLWRPFFLSFLLIVINPATLLPIYSINFELCYTRNLFFGFVFSNQFQVAIAICYLCIVIYLAVISKIAKNNSATSDDPDQ